MSKDSMDGKLIMAPVGSILPSPHQPRKIFNEEALKELSASILKHGLIQPVTVRPGGAGLYELIAGERRWRAASMAGYTEIPAVLLDVDKGQSASLALIENLQRENLHYLEEAEGYNNLLQDFGMTQEELAEQIGKSQASIANKLRVSRMHPDVKKALLDSALTERHARALLRLGSPTEQLRVIKIITARQLNVKQTEEVVKQLIESRSIKKKKPIRVFRDVRIFLNTINQAVNLMNEAGIGAVTVKHEDEEYISYTVKIPKR